MVPADPTPFRYHLSRIEDGEPNWVASSGFRGLRSLTLTLGPLTPPSGNYTLRLVFAEVDPIQPGERAFDVKIQGIAALENFDIVKAAGATNRAVVEEFPGVEIEGSLTIDLIPKVGGDMATVLCGFELLREDDD
jgi:hypothetical protein